MSKREKYIEKIHSLFIECGVADLTMDEIAKRIGVTKMTLYNNFDDKDNLINEVILYRKSSYATYMRGFVSDNLNAIEMLIGVLEFQKNNPLPSSHIFYKSLLENYPRQFKQLQMVIRKNMEMFIRANIEQGVKEGIYRSNFDPDQIISYIMATMNSMLNHWVLETKKGEINLNLTHQQFINYHIRGIANDRGIKILEKYQNDNL